MPENQQKLVRKSLMTIKAHTDVRGGIIASCDSSIYNYGRDYYSYVWPRDGAYAMWPLIRLGYTEEPKAFFKFCADILTPEGYLMHKYQPDRAIGSTWHPLIHNNVSELAIQEDETATVLIMIGEYLEYSGDENFVNEMYGRFVKKAAEFIVSFIDETTGLPHASYDLWEEKFLTSTYTTATASQALSVASELAQKFGSSDDARRWLLLSDKLVENGQIFINPDTGAFRKGFLLNQQSGELSFDDTLDVSSFYGVMMFNYSPSQNSAIVSTIKRIEDDLMKDIPAGGSPRYENDYYFKVSDEAKPNPWLITTLWLAQYYVRLNNSQKAEELMAWVESKTLPSGVMPEQVHSIQGTPVSVTPLVWSHAEYINTALDLAQKNSQH
jgi:GH15 family glucan-1,4-alpha-glucosidase